MSKIYYLNRLFPNSNFRDEDEKIIERIIESIKSKAIIDIRTVAQMNYTSQSSISRLAKRAGFNNFKELIFFLSKEFSHRSTNQLEYLPFVSVTQDWDQIDSYFNDAFSNKKIYLFGEGFCQTLVNYTYRKLLLKKIYAIDLEGVEISSVSGSNTIYLNYIFSIRRKQKRFAQMDECKIYGGKVIALTATEHSSYTAKSDLSFIVESGSTGINYENQNLNYFFGNSLNLMEYLINRYTKA